MMSKKLLAAFCVASLCLSGAALAQDKTPESKHEHKDKDHKHSEGEKKMAKLKIGDAAPAFELTDTGGKTVKLADFKGKIVVLEWFNPECPVVVNRYAKADTMKKMKTEFKDKNVVFLAINSGGPGLQGNGTEKNANIKTEWKIDHPILLDESGHVGRMYGAKTTPHMYVINTEGKLAYMGAIDNGTGGKAGDKNHVTNAVNELIAGKKVTTTETEPFGCGVKYAKDSKDSKKGG